MKEQTITTEQLKEARKHYRKDIYVIINGEYYTLTASDPDPITAKIETAKRIIREYNDSHPDFNPYTIITGGETQQEKIYCAAVEFLAEIENAAEEMNKKTTFSVNLF